MNILKGIGVVLVAIFLFGLSQAFAGTEDELKKLLGNKRTVYVGTCHLNDKGMFRDKEAKYTVHQCIIGTDDSEPGEVYYALLMHQSEAFKLIRIDKDAKPIKQTVLWVRTAEPRKSGKML
jgi:hypothetical protein